MVSMAERKNILIVNGKESIWKALKKELVEKGYNVEEVFDGDAGLEELDNGEFHLVLISSRLSEIEGNRILKSIKETHPSVEVIVFAENSTMRSAFDSMRLGAYDYLTKPFDIGQVVFNVERVIERCGKRKNGRDTHPEISRKTLTSDMVGESSAMKSIFNLIKKVAPADSAVLIQGETGTGKELIAKAIHENSSRWDKSFIVVNCSAIPDTLLESELFGHEKGAFTDATRLKYGLLEAASGGTLFLDEVSEISPIVQSKLLRVVETGSFRRLGSNREIQVDLRIISATNKDLYREVLACRFREDLYYRLSVVNVYVPPLRERPEDIPLLVNFFLDNLRVSDGTRRTISPEALEMLKGYGWSGNVRELRNVIERGIILSERSKIEATDLQPIIQKNKASKQLLRTYPEEGYVTLKEMESVYIEKVLEHCRGHRSRAAQVLGITRHTLYNKLKNFGIDHRRIESFRSAPKR